jgi:hypothetical protein
MTVRVKGHPGVFTVIGYAASPKGHLLVRDTRGGIAMVAPHLIARRNGSFEEENRYLVQLEKRARALAKRRADSPEWADWQDDVAWANRHGHISNEGVDTLYAIASAARDMHYETIGPNRRRNPSLESAAMTRARREYEAFHWGNRPSGARAVKAPHAEGPLVAIGKLVALEYKCAKGGKKKRVYRHEMGEESGRQPTLAYDRKKKLHIVGGGYRIKPEGIVD